MSAKKPGRDPVKCSTEGCTTMLVWNHKRKGTQCRACHDAARRNPPRSCSVCGIPITRRTRAFTGLCRSHAAQSAERIEKQRVSAAPVHADPEFQRRRGAAITRKALAHIPVEYRPLYRFCMYRKAMTAKECAAAVRSQMEADQRAFNRTGQLQQSRRI